MKKRKKNFLILGLAILGIIGIIASLVYFQIPQRIIRFEYGFEPYGESPLSITSGYWDIQPGINQLTSPTKIDGDDFNIHIFGMKRSSIQFTSVESFSDKTFKANIKLRVTKDRQGGIVKSCFSVQPSGITRCVEESANTGSQEQTYSVVVDTNPIDNRVDTYINGEKVSENYIDNFNIEIRFYDENGANGVAEAWLIDSSWRELYGCSKLPNEQYYIRAFNEGERVSLDRLSEFKKFCLDFPLTIYTPSGSTQDSQVLIELIEGNDYVVPKGQIWTVEYIGDIEDPQTECESGEVYDFVNGECLVRTILTYEYLGGEVTIETEPIQYELIDIRTHRNLEENSKFVFVHKNIDGSESDSSFVIGETQFISNGVNSGIGSFNYGGSQSITEGQIIELNDYLTIKAEDVQYDDGDFYIKYLFEIDTDFITPELNKDVVIISNNFESFDGGIIETKTNNLDETTVTQINGRLNYPKSTFDLDFTDVREIKIKPFITIDTPEYTYNIQTKKAIGSQIEEGIAISPEIEISFFDKYKFLLWGIPIVLGVLLFYSLYKILTRKNIKRRKT